MYACTRMEYVHTYIYFIYIYILHYTYAYNTYASFLPRKQPVHTRERRQDAPGTHNSQRRLAHTWRHPDPLKVQGRMYMYKVSTYTYIAYMSTHTSRVHATLRHSAGHLWFPQPWSNRGGEEVPVLGPKRFGSTVILSTHTDAHPPKSTRPREGERAEIGGRQAAGVWAARQRDAERHTQAAQNKTYLQNKAENLDRAPPTPCNSRQRTNKNH